MVLHLAMQIATNSYEQRTCLPNAARAVLMVSTGLWCVYWFFHSLGYWEDDAYIHLEFARSLAAGRGFVFNGLLVSGDTAPLWVVLLAAAHAVVPDWLGAGKLLTVLGALFGLSGTYGFSQRIGRELLPGRVTEVFPGAVVLLVAAGPYTCYWLFSGMESVAAAGLACWAILAATRERPTVQSFLAGCALAGLGPLLRPEMLLFPVLLAWPLLRQLKRTGASPSVRPLLAGGGALLLVAPLAVWSLYSLHAFGQLLPSTVAAKRAGVGESVLLRLLRVYLLGLPLAFAGLATLPVFLRRNRRLPLAAVLFLLWMAVSFAFYIVNHTYVQSRYALLTAPGLFAIVAALALAVWPRSGRAMYAAALVWSVLLSVAIVRPFLRNKEINCRTSAQMARFIRDRIPPDAPVATYSIGEIAFLSEHPIVDTGGITRPGALKYLNAPPSDALRWAESQGAQYDIAGSSQAPEPGAVAVFTIEAPFAGWDLDLRRYSEQHSVSLWRLSAGPSQQASSSLFPQP